MPFINFDSEGPGRGAYSPALMRGQRKNKLVTGVLDFSEIAEYPSGGLDFSEVLAEFKDFGGVTFERDVGNSGMGFELDRATKKVRVGYTTYRKGYGVDLPSIAAGAMHTHDIGISWPGSSNTFVNFAGFRQDIASLGGLIVRPEPWYVDTGGGNYVLRIHFMNPTAAPIDPATIELTFDLSFGGWLVEEEALSDLTWIPDTPFIAWGQG